MDGSVSQHRIFCWTSPRSLSTVFMKCLSTIESSVAWLEPYGTAVRFDSNSPLKQTSGVQQSTEYTHEWVRKRLENDFQGYSAVIVKDFAFAVTGKLQCLPKGYRHSFLIRQPLKSFMSYYRGLEKVSVVDIDTRIWSLLPQEGMGYGELVQLVDYVEKVLGQQLVIVDADDILNYPDVMLQKYCSALGLPFSESILTWEPGLPSNWIVPKPILEAEKELKSMATVLGSRCFNKGHQKPSNIGADEIPQIVTKMKEVAQPFYDKLYARRILPS